MITANTNTLNYHNNVQNCAVLLEKKKLSNLRHLLRIQLPAQLTHRWPNAVGDCRAASPSVVSTRRRCCGAASYVVFSTHLSTSEWCYASLIAVIRNDSVPREVHRSPNLPAARCRINASYLWPLTAIPARSSRLRSPKSRAVRGSSWVRTLICSFLSGPAKW